MTGAGAIGTGYGDAAWGGADCTVRGGGAGAGRPDIGIGSVGFTGAAGTGGNAIVGVTGSTGRGDPSARRRRALSSFTSAPERS